MTHQLNDWYIYALTAAMLVGSGAAMGQASVTHGKITAVKPMSAQDTQAQGAGALVGGTIGLISGRNRSGSNQALRTIGGGIAGQQIAKHASSKQVFEYTILVDAKSTLAVVTDEGGMRIGDCVAVERGAYTNLRLVADAQCATRAKVTAANNRDAANCNAAKDELLKANDDESFARAERKVRLLCAD